MYRLVTTKCYPVSVFVFIQSHVLSFQEQNIVNLNKQVTHVVILVELGVCAFRILCQKNILTNEKKNVNQYLITCLKAMQYIYFKV